MSLVAASCLPALATAAALTRPLTADDRALHQTCRPVVVPRGVLGPPAHLAALHVGTQSLSASRSCSITGDAIEFEVDRMSSRPACFHVGGLLSEAECDHIVAAADAVGMVQASTKGADIRHNCGVAWLPVEHSPRGAAPCFTAASIAAACAQIFLTPEAQAPDSRSVRAARPSRAPPCPP